MREDDGLTAEQKTRMENNRLLALERLKQRHQRLEQQGKTFAPTSVPLPAPVVAQVNIRLEARKKADVPRERVQVETQMETFELSTSWKIITGGSQSPNTKTFVQCSSLLINEALELVDKLGPNRPAVESQIPKAVLHLFAHPGTSPRSYDLQCLDRELLESLYPFQREGIELALNRNGRILLADDMGLGKSIQALGIATFYRIEWPLLILAPASMVASWYEQVKRWLPSVPVDRIVAAYDGKSSLHGLVNILSYDLATKIVPKSSLKFQVIIADESHALKNSESKRCKILLPVLKAASRVILLSGTPALSRPLELYPQICAVQPNLFPKFFDFGKRYCNGQQSYFGWDFKGFSNLKELQLVMERTVMLRRTKDSVLSQLPRKLRHQVFLKVDKKELDTFKKLADLRTLSQDASDEALEEFQKKTEYMALWKRSAEIKMPATLEYIDDLLESGHKMLVFAHHQSILDTLEAHLLVSKTRAIRICGKTTPSSRQDLCTAFQTDSSLRVALLSITAASTGLTLTAATTVIFAELFWNPGVMLQAEDRAHRIGQCDAVNVHYLLAKGTIDDSIWPMILRKLNMLEAVGLGRNDFATMPKQEHDRSQTKLDTFIGKRKRPGDDGVLGQS